MTSLPTFAAKDFKSDLKPIWCPGCGDFGVVQAIYRALANIGRPPHEIAFISGIGFSSGGGPVPHAIRRNIDLTYIVMDNQIYGLTKGQLSPTSEKGRKTVTSAYGSLEQPVNPRLYTLAFGAGFVAQATPADMAGMAQVIEEAIRYPGFAFVNVQSPCVTYGLDNQ